MTAKLTNFFNLLWRGNEGKRIICYGDAGKAPNKFHWFDVNQNAIDFANDLPDTYNLYHGCALFKDATTRKAANAITINALWLDIDAGGDITKAKDIVKELLKHLTTTVFGSDCYIVNSGNGFHLYWMLDQGIEPTAWKVYAEELKKVSSEIYKNDHSRTCDAASILRFPYSLNNKDAAQPKKTSILIEQKTLLAVDKLTIYKPVITKPTTLDLLPTADDNLMNMTVDYPPSNAETIREKCAFIKEFSTSGFSQSEPAWYAALGVVKFCENGNHLCHEWSKADPRYSEKETNAKLQQLDTKVAAPSRCDKISELGFCVECHFKSKITTPVQLGFEVTKIDNQEVLNANARVKETRADECLKAAPTHPWQIGRHGVYKDVDDVLVSMCGVPFYIIDLVIEGYADETVVAAVVLAYIKGRSTMFTLPLRLLPETKKLLAEFNCRKIFPTSAKLLAEYIQTYVMNLDAHGIMPQRIAINLGWQKDGAFIYKTDGQALTKDEESLKYLMDKKMIGYAGGFTSKGSLTEWLKIFNVYEKDSRFNPHLLSLLCSIANPLLPHTAAKGIVLSLEGTSGCGKTLAHKIAMSVWGDPDTAGVLGTKDTQRAVLGRLASIKHLPLRLDEATTLHPKQLCGLIFDLVNGRGRSKATIDGSLAMAAADWQTMTMITTNRPLLDADLKTLTEAERFRILEIPVDMPNHMEKVGRQLGGIIEKNHGLLGKEFIKWMFANWDTCLNLLEEMQTELLYVVDSSKRFWVACSVIALIAAKFIKDNYGVDFSYIKDWILALIKQQDDQIQETIIETRGFETLDEFISALVDSLNGYIEYSNENGVTMEAKNEIKGRIVTSHPFGKILYIRPPVLKDFISNHYIEGFKKVKATLEISNSQVRSIGYKKIRCYKFVLGE